jgi:stage IV sporulation protein FB
MRESSNWTLNLGRFAGVPVRLHASFIVGAMFAIYIAGKSSSDHDYSFYGFLFALIWFGSLLLHQFGHLVAAWRIGANVDRIVIGPLGDMAPATVPHEPHRELVVALAGPVTQLLVLVIVTPALIVAKENVLELVLSPLGPHNLVSGGPNGDGFWLILLKLTFWCNWLLFLVNLLPAFPLDSGRALFCGLRPALGDKVAIDAVARGGLIVTVIALMLWSFLAQGGADAPLVPIWLPLSLLTLHLFFTARNEMARLDDDERDGDLLGYDFSQGYTSLERGGENSRRRGPNFIQSWLEKRRDQKRRRAREIEEEEERRVDEILARVKDAGMGALSAEERALLERVSQRYRNRQGNP